MEIYGLRVGERDIEKSLMFFNEGFDNKVTISYYFWCIKNEKGITLIDTGFSPEVAEERNVRNFKSPLELLKELNINPKDVKNVILTHLHWDHFGGYSYFPNANFYVHKDEWAFATGKFSETKVIKEFYDNKLLQEGNQLKNNNRLVLTEGIFDLNEDIQLIPLGGHTPGSQVIVVNPHKKPIIFCGDLGYFYRNFTEKNPPMINLNITESLEAYFKLEQIVKEKDGKIIPGHDPKLIDLFEKISNRIIKVI